MANEEIKLPGSSLDEIEKIVEGYSEKSGPATNEEVAVLCGLDKTTVSRNNGFLVALGVLEGGRTKEASALGRNLGRALRHQQGDDVRRYWQQAVANNPFLSEQITAVRVQKGVQVDELAGKILYNSKAGKNAKTEAGARAIVDLLLKAGLLKERDGKYEVAREAAEPLTEASPPPAVVAPPPAPRPLEPEGGNPLPPAIPAAGRAQVEHMHAQPFSLAINLQLQLPEFEDTTKYDDLFRSLRKHLLTSPDEAGSAA